jgi:hypothetical protein
VVNVRDYEYLVTEKPDPADRSTCDYRPAFEAAMASLRKGSRLYAPAGIYRTSSSLSLGVEQNQMSKEMGGQITRVLSAGGADPAADLVVKLQIQSENI